MIVYKIQNKINGKIYIGITKKSINERIKEHFITNSLIGKALRKYGSQCFDITIITHDNNWTTLCDKEMEYICFYDSKYPNGYNLTDGGDGIYGYTFTKQVKQRMSESQLGKKRAPRSKESKEKYAAKMKLLWQDPEYREMQIKSHKGYKQTEQTKEKLRKPRSEEFKAKLRKPRGPLSEEVKQRMRVKKTMSETGKINITISNQNPEKIKKSVQKWKETMANRRI